MASPFGKAARRCGGRRTAIRPTSETIAPAPQPESDCWRPGPATRSGQPAARRDRQLTDDLASPHRNEAIDHIDDHADMVRDDAHDVADLGAVVARRKVQETVLFRKARDLRLRMLEDEAVAV